VDWNGAWKPFWLLNLKSYPYLCSRISQNNLICINFNPENLQINWIDASGFRKAPKHFICPLLNRKTSGTSALCLSWTGKHSKIFTWTISFSEKSEYLRFWTKYLI